MNKSKIQKFAVDGHKLLYKQIAQRAYQYGIEEGNVGKADATEVRGRILSPLEKSQRAALIAEINANGYPQTYRACHLYLVQPHCCASVYGGQ